MGRGRRKGCKNGVASCNGNSCMKCGDDRRAARNAKSTWTPGDNGTVSGQPAEIQQGHTGREDRIDAYWPSGDPSYGHLVANDGLNASYLREPGSDDAIVDDRQ